MNTTDHEYFLKRALLLAKQRAGFCAPNPSVGAIVVKDNRVISEGHHWAAGHPHAEVVALENIDFKTCSQSTLYVTLEPCAHSGLTPPCTQLILKKGIKKVVYGFSDPNLHDKSGGAFELTKHGVNCERIKISEIDAFYRSYSYWVAKKIPFVTAKLAMSLDGKIAKEGGERCLISGSKARDFTHEYRLRSDAILTTARTIKFDNPQLNARLDGVNYSKTIYIVDSELNTPSTAQIFDTSKQVVILYCNDDGRSQAKERLRSTGAELRRLPYNEKMGGIDLKSALAQIGSDGIHDLWVEAGGILFSSLINEKMINRSLFYICPRWLGSSAISAFSRADWLKEADNLSWKPLGSDVLCEIDWNN